MAFPVHGALIEAGVQQLGRALPAGLRERLLRNNRGEISAGDEIWTLHPVWTHQIAVPWVAAAPDDLYDKD